MRIVNLTEMDPHWKWLESSFSERRDWQWAHVSDQTSMLGDWVPRRRTVARIVAGWQAAGHLDGDDAVLVTHGPRPSMYASFAAELRRRTRRHLAFSFNFTDLPKGAARGLMARAFRHVDRFVVFSTMERRLYAEYFDLPIERFDMLHWGVQASAVPADAIPIESGDYVCAVGSQARDYAVLVEAMRRLPSIKLVLVATRESLAGISIPDNVRVHTSIPIASAMNIVAFSRFMVLPLRDSEVPCGHVTLVSAMYMGKAILGTDSSGVTDYLQPGINGRVMPARDPDATAAMIQAMYDDPGTTEKLGEAGRAFAFAHCAEHNTVDYVTRYLTAE